MNATPRTTTLVGGMGLAVVGLLGLLPFVLDWVPAAPDSLSVLRSGPAQGIRDLALLVSCLILAFGLRHETGISARSLPGRVAFVVLAVAFPVQRLASFVLLSPGQSGTPSVVVVGTALEILPIAAVLVAAVAVVRAGILDGFARWSLLVYGLTEAIVFAMVNVPNASQTYTLVVFFYVAALSPLLLLAAGASFVLSGRSAAVKQKVRAVYVRWQATT